MESETATLFGGINIDTIGTGKKQDEILSSIVKPFNKAITKLLNGVINEEKTSSIKKTIHLINAAKKLDPVLIIRKCYDYLIDEKTKDALLRKDIEFFKEKDYAYAIKKNRWEETINFIISHVKKRIDDLNENELSEIWDLVWVLLICSEYYEKYVEDHIKK